MQVFLRPHHGAGEGGRERERLSAVRQAPGHSADCLSYGAGASGTGLERHGRGRPKKPFCCGVKQGWPELFPSVGTALLLCSDMCRYSVRF